MISSSKGTVLCAISLSIDLFIKNLIYKEHKNKPNAAGCIRGSELMRSKFMRVWNCYFHFLLFCCWEGQWGEVTCYRTRAPLSLGLVLYPSTLPRPSLLHPSMKLHFSGMRVGFLESWHGLGYGQKPLSSAPVILFYKILGCDYSLLQPESSSWKAVCPKEGGIYSRVEDIMGYSGKILLYSWYTWNMDLRVWSLDSAAAVSSGWWDRDASSWGPSQINWLRNSGDGARQALTCPSVFF